MNNLSRIIVIVALLTSCSSGRQTIDKPRSWGDYIYIDGKKVLIDDLIDDKHIDSVQYKTDSSYMKNKRIESDMYSQVTENGSIHSKHWKNQFDPSTDFMSSWIYFNLTDTVELNIIHHIKATMDCDSDTKTFSITIGTMQSGDTIRVLELCNSSKNFNVGEKVFIIPSEKPKEFYTHPGVFVQGSAGQLKPGPYDTEILKTTYGILKTK